MRKYIIEIYKGINLIRHKGINECILRVLEKIIYNRIINKQLKTYINNIESVDNSIEQVNIKINPKISVVVPVYKTNIIYLKDMIESLKKQNYNNWELCIFNGGSREPGITELINKYSREDSRIIYSESDKNYGISGNTNKALEMATGEYVGLLDHDDILVNNALYECIKVINFMDVDIIYTDEDKVTDDGKYFLEEHIKSKWAPNTLLSYNYICHFLLFKSSLLKKTGKFDSNFDGSQDYDFIMRLTKEAENIYHIPKVLYHWRISSQSTALSIDIKDYALYSGKRALEKNIKEQNLKYKVIKGRFNGSYIYINNSNNYNKVTIVVIGKWRSKKEILKTLQYIKNKTDYKNYSFIFYNKVILENIKIKDVRILSSNKKNYSQIMNEILEVSENEINIILDYKIKIIDNEWCKKLVTQSQEENVYIVSGKIMKNKYIVYSNGISITNKDIIEDYRNCYSKFYGYMGKNTIIRNVTAVNSKAYLIKKSIANVIGVFDDNYKSEIALMDYCIKLNLKGKFVKVIPDEIFRYSKIQREDKEDKLMLLNNYKNILKNYDLYNPIKYN